MNEQQVSTLCKKVISVLMELSTTVISNDDSYMDAETFVNICCQNVDPPVGYTGKTDEDKYKYQLEVLTKLSEELKNTGEDSKLSEELTNK